jgi:uncharacterized protein
MKELCRNVSRLAPEIEFVWHAGEPLAVDRQFYEEAFTLIDELCPSNTAVLHTVQTNGTLINDAWCALFLKHRVSVGVSIDGPAHIHDAQRRRRNGGSTFEATLNGVRKLQEHTVPFECLAVLTALSLNYPDELFHFFEQIGVTRVSFNVEEQEAAHKETSLAGIEAVNRFRDFLARYLHLISSSGSIQQVREIEIGINRVIGGAQAPIGNELTRPFRILTVDYRGNFSTFCPELMAMAHPTWGSFVLGNILQDSFDDVWRSERYIRLASEIAAGVRECENTCSYFSVCGGGAPSNKVWEHGTFVATETQWCRLRTFAVTDVVVDHVYSKISPLDRASE